MRSCRSRPGNGRRLAAALLAAATALAGQAEPCSGVVRDVAGTPLAGAQVTFVQEWSQTFGRAMHRVEAATDSDGRFIATLHPGSPYMAWAIGPANAAGERLVSATTMRAGAGRVVDFVAHLPRSPRKVRLRGVAPWVDAAPPSLRVMVGGVYALGRDLPLPGDGTVTVGPWPDDDVVAAIVDGRGDVIERSELVEDSTTVVEFRAPRTFVAEVTDTAGVPIAGATLHTKSPLNTWPRDVVPSLFPSGWRTLARTDAKGRATVRVPTSGELTVVATHPEHAAGICGSIDDTFHHDGQAAGEQSLRFALAVQTPMRWSLVGLRAEERPWVQFATNHACTTERAVTVGDLMWPATTDATDASAPVLRIGLGVHGLVRLPARSGSTPCRIVVAALGPATGLRPFDVSTAREEQVQFSTPDGRPAPFVDVAIAPAGGNATLRWHDRTTSDASGRLVLRCDRGMWYVRAANDVAFAQHELGNGTEPGDVRITLRPFAVATLHVRDATGARVVGARTDLRHWTKPVKSTADTWTLDLANALLRSARSDASGVLRVPLPVGALQGVVWRDAQGRRSKPMTVEPGEAAANVTLR